MNNKNKIWRNIVLMAPPLVYIIKNVNTATFYEILSGILIFVFLGTATITDIESRRIPNKLVTSITVLSIFLQIWNIAMMPENIKKILSSMFFGVIVSSGLLLLMAIILESVFKVNEGIGMGDVKLFIPVGIILGPLHTYVALSLSILLCAIYCVYKTIKEKSLKFSFPFAPFLYISLVILYLSII